ncbi:hypothetical protein HUB98_06240 [Paenibacillus barcinonensis]|uniref:Uncharacterized protein n=1 Tax=Paenibacillus barcinonensis TaxID=198119 RepID=A0A2V4VEW3_PAEBA|nr:hypothetical protein [Paenibacillus barcinonensis]PYE51614.1 hypothetical protein DFQ00_102409 [Paenibacillus barcinonensis]QKS55980.1 hypothetical protein HUB98_06240 [Paenibacillus barcinonensis]
MHYLDKQEAKVNIMYKLVDSGWQVFGYKQDESDSMVDYYSPASWSGVATKNGYVLLVDVCKYNLSDSGREVRKYDYNKQSYVANSRIEKLTAMMNDAASTENEKASCAVLIEKEIEKANVEPSYTVIETYPTFAFANPKGASWHIEKDGQIIAKGNGVYATNTYDWENKEKSASQQKEEKVSSLIKRIEKALSDCDALKPEIVKVPVKTIQVVEKSVNEVTEADIKEGFTFAMKVGYTHGASKGNRYTLIHIDQQFNKYHTFAKLGKNNKPSKSIDKSWSLSVDKINSLLGKGHIAVIEFVEVTEYVEKTVYKKTTRKQSVSSVPAIETTQQNESSEEGNETVNENGNEELKAVSVVLNEEKNGIEISFTEKPDPEVIEELKSNGFRWSRFNGGKWWAKQSPETITFAESLKVNTNDLQGVPHKEDAETPHKQENNTVDSNLKENSVTQEEKPMNNEELANNTETFDDIFSKFDEIEITNDQRVSDDDYKFCQEQETNYKALIVAYENFYSELNKVPHGSFHGVMSSYEYENSLKKIKESFIRNICYHFINKYKVTIDSEKIIKKLDFESDFQDVLDNIFIQLEGCSFTEKAEKEIKDNTKEIFKYGEKILIKGNKLNLDGYFAHYDSIWKRYELNEDRVSKILASLQLFDSGLLTINEELKDKYCGYQNLLKLENYERYTTQEMKKVKTIKFFKNGKLDIEFIGNQEAARFASEYCGYKKVAV